MGIILKKNSPYISIGIFRITHNAIYFSTYNTFPGFIAHANMGLYMLIVLI